MADCWVPPTVGAENHVEQILSDRIVPDLGDHFYMQTTVCWAHVLSWQPFRYNSSNLYKSIELKGESWVGWHDEFHDDDGMRWLVFLTSCHAGGCSLLCKWIRLDQCLRPGKNNWRGWVDHLQSQPADGVYYHIGNPHSSCSNTLKPQPVREASVVTISIWCGTAFKCHLPWEKPHTFSRLGLVLLNLWWECISGCGIWLLQADKEGCWGVGCWNAQKWNVNLIWTYCASTD